MDNTSLCLVDNELKSLLDAPLQPLLRHVNAHCNLLRELAGLERVTGLVSLDLSANQLASMRGLECLAKLKVLNISCNKLEALESLDSLIALEWLDASHNAISDISNLSSLGHGRLESLLLHGNRLQSSQHLLRHLADIRHSLRHLSLWSDRPEQRLGSPGLPDESERALSPLENALWTTLPSLVILNSSLTTGEAATFPQPSAYLQTDEDYMYALSELGDGPAPAIATPHIDQVLNRLATSHRRHLSPTGSASELTTTSSSRPSELEKPEEVAPTASEKSDSMTSPPVRPVRAPQLKSTAAAGGGGGGGRKHLTKFQPAKPAAQSSGKGRSARPNSGRNPQQVGGRVPVAPTAVVTRHISASKPGRASVEIPHEKVASSDSSSSTSVDDSQRPEHNYHAAATGVIQATDQSTLQQEVERRVKAEHAMQLLTSTVQRLQGEVSSLKSAGVRWKQQWVQASAQLQAVVKETDAVKTELRAEKELTTNLQSKVTQQSSDAGLEIGQLKEKLSTLDSRYSVELKEERNEVERVKLLCARHQQDAEAMRATVTAQSSQAQFLQAMVGDLMNKEHAKLPEELSRLISERGSGKQESDDGHVALVKQLHKEIDEKEKQYGALENEFREALKIEAARYQELQGAAEEQAHRTLQLSDALNKMETKEKQATAMVSRLTTVLREQQDKVRDLMQQQLDAKPPSEVRASYERQIASLEATIAALKDEQQRWQREHHEQDGALRRERLDLEMKLSKATAQAGSARLQVQEANESLVIKSKMLDDQNAAIKELKEKLAQSRSQRSEESRSMASRLQQSEENLASVSISHQDIQEEVDTLTQRKQQLKAELATATEQLGEFDSACSVLQEQIGKKDALIADQKASVEQLKQQISTMDDELRVLRSNMDEQSRGHAESLVQQQTAFQQESTRKTEEHTEELLAVKQVHDKMLQEAEQKVMGVEHEMRTLLEEQEAKQADVQTLLSHLHGLVTPGPAAPPPPLQQLPVRPCTGANQQHHPPYGHHGRLQDHPPHSHGQASCAESHRQQHSQPIPGHSNLHSHGQIVSGRGHLQQATDQRRQQHVAAASSATAHPRRKDADTDSTAMDEHRYCAKPPSPWPHHGAHSPHGSELQREVEQKLQRKQHLIQQLQQLNAVGSTRKTHLT